MLKIADGEVGSKIKIDKDGYENRLKYKNYRFGFVMANGSQFFIIN